MKYAFPVSRWHKITERLTNKATEIAKETKQVFCQTSVDGFYGEDQINRIQKSVVSAEEQLTNYSTISNGIALIRSSIAKANVALNVNSLLAEQEALNRHLKLLKEIIEAQKPGMVEVASLEKYQSFIDKPKSRISFKEEEKGIVSIKTLSLEKENELKEKVKEIQSKLYFIADKVNDLNREVIEIELSKELAQIVGI